MSALDHPRESRRKGKFKGLLDRLIGANHPPDERPGGSRSIFTRAPQGTGDGTSLNVMQGARNIVVRDSTFYVAKNIEVHEHTSRGQDDTLLVPQRPNSSALFKGCEHILERLKDHFAPQDEGDRCRKSFLLYGMGGIGKTQICLKFVEVMAGN